MALPITYHALDHHTLHLLSVKGIFYNQKKLPDGTVEHLGDNRTGAGEGDDEQLQVKVSAMAADVSKMVFGVTIHEAGERTP